MTVQTPVDTGSVLDGYTAELNLDMDLPSIPIIDELFCIDGTICIQFPWGFELCTFAPLSLPDSPCAHVDSLLGPLNSLLGSIAPFVLIINVVLAIQTCMVAIPKAILTLDPGLVFECLEDLAAVIIALICALYPPFSFPIFIQSIVEFLKSVLDCVISNVSALCEAIDRLANLQNLIDLDPSASASLTELLTVARFNIDCRTKSNAASMLSICSLIALVNSFIQIANELSPEDDGEPLMPEIGCPEFGIDTPCDELLAILTEIKDSLDSFTAIIPECP